MVFFERLSRYQPYALAALRIIAALLFIQHGTQKFFNFPASASPMEGALSPMMLVAATLEFGGGLLVLVGLFTRPTAFLLSGLMAFAYFLAHAPESVFPILNGGDSAILFCFVFLYLVFAGAGALSVDASRR